MGKSAIVGSDDLDISVMPSWMSRTADVKPTKGQSGGKSMIRLLYQGSAISHAESKPVVANLRASKSINYSQRLEEQLNYIRQAKEKLKK